MDFATGERGQRVDRVESLLCNLSDAESAIVVNNNAAAVFLMMKAVCEGGEVLVSRGELVEIGGSFRNPDILKEAGAKLIEVGTTNRTRLSDYQKNLSDRTIAVLKVHPSNYSIQGFTEEVSLNELVINKASLLAILSLTTLIYSLLNSKLTFLSLIFLIKVINIPIIQSELLIHNKENTIFL